MWFHGEFSFLVYISAFNLNCWDYFSNMVSECSMNNDFLQLRDIPYFKRHIKNKDVLPESHEYICLFLSSLKLKLADGVCFPLFTFVYIILYNLKGDFGIEIKSSEVFLRSTVLLCRMVVGRRRLLSYVQLD